MLRIYAAKLQKILQFAKKIVTLHDIFELKRKNADSLHRNEYFSLLCSGM